MRLLIVIVNYKSAGLTEDCLVSLTPQLQAFGDTAHVHLVENHSGEEEPLRQVIEDHALTDRVTLIPADRNAGFAAGNNLGIAPALAWDTPPEFVLLLNPDTVVRDAALPALLKFMDEHPSVGIAGSRLEDADGTPQRSAFRFPSTLSEFEGRVRFGPVSRVLTKHVVAPPVRDQAHQTDWVAGASMIVRRGVFDAIGLLDEGYFMYFEEVDFCLRAHRAGWPTWYVPQSRVVHLVGQSSGVTNTTQRPGRRPAYWFESRRRYFQKNHGNVALSAADAAAITGQLGFKLKRALKREPDRDPPHLLTDLARHAYLGPSKEPPA